MLTGGLAILALAGCITVVITKGDTGFKTGQAVPFLYASIALFFLFLFCASRTFRRTR